MLKRNRNHSLLLFLLLGLISVFTFGYFLHLPPSEPIALVSHAENSWPETFSEAFSETLPDTQTPELETSELETFDLPSDGSNPSTQLAQNLTNSNLRQVPIEEMPLGWYSSIRFTEFINQLPREGMNTVVTYAGTADDQAIANYLTAANTAKLKVLLGLPPRVTPNRQRGEDLGQLRAFVRKFKDYPALYAWYSYDEPELNKVPPERANRVYRAIKAEDTTHPIAVAFANYERATPYLNSLDIFMLDRYPCWQNRPEFGGLSRTFTGANYVSFRDNLRGAQAMAAANGKPFWFILQGYGPDIPGSPVPPLENNNKRFCSANEFRYMFYTALLTKAQGLLLWSRPRSQPQWIEEVVNPVVREFQPYAAMIQTNATSGATSSNQDTIQVQLYSRDRRQVLIAINHRMSNANTTINLPRSAFRQALDSSGRTVTLRNGRLIDNFAPHEVKVYTFR